MPSVEAALSKVVIRLSKLPDEPPVKPDAITEVSADEIPGTAFKADVTEADSVLISVPT